MKNLGTGESRGRIKLALITLAQAWFALDELKTAFILLACYLITTAFFHFCPLWRWLGIDSREVHSMAVLPALPNRKH